MPPDPWEPPQQGHRRAGARGLPDPKENALFHSFERRGADRTGLGLGLKISRDAVKADGGEIRVRNLPGKGCVFTIELPITPA